MYPWHFSRAFYLWNQLCEPVIGIVFIQRTQKLKSSQTHCELLWNLFRIWVTQLTSSSSSSSSSSLWRWGRCWPLWSPRWDARLSQYAAVLTYMFCQEPQNTKLWHYVISAVLIPFCSSIQWHFRPGLVQTFSLFRLIQVTGVKLPPEIFTLRNPNDPDQMSLVWQTRTFRRYSLRGWLRSSWLG